MKKIVQQRLLAMLMVIPRSFGIAFLIALITPLTKEQLWWTVLAVYVFMCDYMYDNIKLQDQINDLVKNKEDKKTEKE